MVKQKESWGVWYIAIASLFVLSLLKIYDLDMRYEIDANFLYNMAYQAFDCFKHGRWPFFYYNDLRGLGYPSCIFYGWEMFIPFFPFLFSKTLFIQVYSVCSLLVNFFGFRRLIKRFSENATLVSCFYILGIPFVYIYGRTGLHAAILAIGLSWFFLAFCVDYFRDGRNKYFLILTYFLVWRTNFNTAVFAVVACFVIFVVYFNKSRLKDYFSLLLFMILFLAYNIVDMCIHIDAIREFDLTDVFSSYTISNPTLTSYIPVGSFVVKLLLYQFLGTDICFGIFTLSSFLVFIWCLVRGLRKDTLRGRVISLCVISLVIVGYIVGSQAVWPLVYIKTHVFFQFPIRYFIFLFGALLVVLSRYIRVNKLVLIALVLCLVDIFVVDPVKNDNKVIEDHYMRYLVTDYGFTGKNYIINGELHDYLSSAVLSNSSIEYTYEHIYDGLVIDCSNNVGNDVLTCPRLWYEGYVAYGEDGEKFEVISGLSNFCEIDIGNYTGSLTLKYEVNRFVFVLFFVQAVCLLYIIRGCILDVKARRA